MFVFGVLIRSYSYMLHNCKYTIHKQKYTLQTLVEPRYMKKRKKLYNKAKSTQLPEDWSAY